MVVFGRLRASLVDCLRAPHVRLAPRRGHRSRPRCVPMRCWRRATLGTTDPRAVTVLVGGVFLGRHLPSLVGRRGSRIR